MTIDSFKFSRMKTWKIQTFFSPESFHWDHIDFFEKENLETLWTIHHYGGYILCYVSMLLRTLIWAPITWSNNSQFGARVYCRYIKKKKNINSDSPRRLLLYNNMFWIINRKCTKLNIIIVFMFCCEITDINTMLYFCSVLILNIF